MINQRINTLQEIYNRNVNKWGPVTLNDMSRWRHAPKGSCPPSGILRATNKRIIQLSQV